MKINRIQINRWFDRHLHLRDGSMLKTVLPCTLAQRPTGALIMPNLVPPVTTIERAIAYRNEIKSHIPEGCDFNPCMSLYLTDHTDPAEVVRGFEEGIWVAAKLYMADKNGQGGTTNSEGAVRNIRNLDKVFEAMQSIGMPLLGHFEAAEEEIDEFDREAISLDRDLQPLLHRFPALQVVVEHVTDYRMADFVAESKHDIYATVTPHHLMISRNALFKGGLNSINWCKPIVKREMHRQALRKYVTSGNPRFGAGTDSAPHPREKKEACCGCAAGAFVSPLAVESYTAVFDEENKAQHLNSFMSFNLLHLYKVDPSEEVITLERRLFEIPKMVGPVHVFKGGETLQWKMVD